MSLRRDEAIDLYDQIVEDFMSIDYYHNDDVHHYPKDYEKFLPIQHMSRKDYKTFLINKLMEYGWKTGVYVNDSYKLVDGFDIFYYKMNNRKKDNDILILLFIVSKLSMFNEAEISKDFTFFYFDFIDETSPEFIAKHHNIRGVQPDTFEGLLYNNDNFFEFKHNYLGYSKKDIHDAIIEIYERENNVVLPNTFSKREDYEGIALFLEKEIDNELSRTDLRNLPRIWKRGSFRSYWSCDTYDKVYRKIANTRKNVNWVKTISNGIISEDLLALHKNDKYVQERLNFNEEISNMSYVVDIFNSKSNKITVEINYTPVCQSKRSKKELMEYASNADILYLLHGWEEKSLEELCHRIDNYMKLLIRY